MTDISDDQNTSGNEVDTPGSLPPEPVENRPSVGSVTPEDYPDAVESDPTGRGVQSPPGLDDEMDFERRNPGG